MTSLINQPVWSLKDLQEKDLGKTAIWCTPSVKKIVSSQLPYPVVEPLTPLPSDLKTLIVIGGGYLMDEAKAWIQDHGPKAFLVAVPSLWGSGAEASPIIVQNRDGKKQIRMNDAFLPNARVVWPELAAPLPEARAKEALGDTWSNAVEGFFSPLAKDDLRKPIAELINKMLALPLGKDPRWFELSAQASTAQAKSSVGLVHGIAHTLEGPLLTAQPQEGWGHARLCAVYLWPVLKLNWSIKPDLKNLLAQYSIDPARVEAVAKELYSEALYDKALPLLESNWPQILRYQCSRTNPVLVRGSLLEFFTQKKFHEPAA